MSNKIADVMTKLVSLLEPLASDERHKAIDAVLVILGETPRGVGPRTRDSHDTRTHERNDGDGWPTHSKFRTWMRQNNLSSNQLAEIFHIENGTVSVIASSVPGTKAAEKSRNAYLLQGVAGLIESGEPTFSDESARSFCRTLGCYDKDNHGNYLRPLGNRLTGSKKNGWKLTNPGLAAAAAIVKEMAGGAA